MADLLIFAEKVLPVSTLAKEIHFGAFLTGLSSTLLGKLAHVLVQGQSSEPWSSGTPSSCISQMKRSPNSLKIKRWCREPCAIQTCGWSKRSKNLRQLPPNSSLSSHRHQAGNRHPRKSLRISSWLTASQMHDNSHLG